MNHDVLLLTDASHSAKTYVAGWAARVERVGDRHIVVSGSPRGLILTSSEAEIWAIAGGLTNGLAQKVILPGDTVLVETDCVAAIASLLVLADGAVQDPAPGGLVIGRPKRLVRSLMGSRSLDVIMDVVDHDRLRLVLRHCRHRRTPEAKELAEEARAKAAELARLTQ